MPFFSAGADSSDLGAGSWALLTYRWHARLVTPWTTRARLEYHTRQKELSMLLDDLQFY
jgi:hypothetical protein